MMEAVSISETSVNLFETTQRNILADSQLHSSSLFTLVSGQNF
jgi:hypothetical protein